MRLRFLLCVGVIAITGCQSVQTTQGGNVGVNRTQYMMSGLSSEEVNEMAAKSYDETLAEARKAGVLNTNAATVRRLRKIADDLTAKATYFRPDAAQWDWEVNLIKDDMLNASCAPGGKILFYSGIIDQLNLTDDEIAQIMGHEIAHALREHGREAISRAYATQMGTQLASALLGLGSGGQQAAQMAVQYGLTLPNSRGNESEADLIGLELAARAGYDPDAAVSLWQKMSAASQGAPPAFMSTHPSSAGRIDALRAAAPSVEPLYQANK